MTNSAPSFSWSALREVCASSAFILPSDDLSTRRGIIAAAAAITDRMFDGERLREVSWRPARLRDKDAPALALDTIPAAPQPTPAPSDDDGGMKVLAPAPKPRKPPPGMRMPLAPVADPFLALLD